MAIMAGIIRLSCRKVVLETLFCIGCKSAKMFIGGFCVSWSCGDLNFTTKALLSQPVFGEGIDKGNPFLLNRMVDQVALLLYLMFAPQPDAPGDSLADHMCYNLP